MKKVLFVCMGNICRSPSAEAVMQHLVKANQLDKKIFCDSAGTIGFHQGETADPRSIDHAARRGIKITSISRKFNPKKDFDEFDYIVVMDNKNYQDIMALDVEGKYCQKVSLMTDHCVRRTEKEVPDPYYQGAQGFELVLDILEDAAQGLLNKIQKEMK